MASSTLESRIRAAVTADDEYRALRRAERQGKGDRSRTQEALRLRNACVDDLCGPEVRSRVAFLRVVLGEVQRG